MKCLKCGSEYTDGTKTCPICGNNSIVAEDNNNQINGNHESMNIKEPSRVQSYQNMSGVYQQYNPPMIPRQKKPVNKKLIGIIAGVAIILIATIIIVVIISKLPKTVKLDGYVKIEVEDGYDGYGKVTYSIDKTKFLKDYSNVEYTTEFKDELKVTYGNHVDAYISANPAPEALADCLYGSFDKDSKLSNGDTVHFEWDIYKTELEKKFNIKLKYAGVDYVVDGLKTPETFDPFENIEVKFSGIDPNGIAEYEITKVDEYNALLNYHLDNSEDLKNGDTVTLSILRGKSEDEIVEYCLDSFGKIPESTEETYTVEIDRYINASSEIDKDTMDAMDKQARDALEAKIHSDWTDPDSFIGITPIGSIFQTSKFGEKINNILFLMYRIEVSTNAYWEGAVEYYWYIVYENIYLDRDNKCNVDLSRYYAPDDDDYKSMFELGSIKKAGCESLDDFRELFIKTKTDKYECEENITDLENGKLISERTSVDSLVGKDLEFNGHRYRLVKSNNGKIEWEEAKKLCENEGGHLVTITSKEEQEFIGRLCGYKDNVMIGLHGNLKKDGLGQYSYEYYWITGENFDYSFWGDTDFSISYFYYNDCVSLQPPYYMWYTGEGSSYYYMCEWDK